MRKRNTALAIATARMGIKFCDVESEADLPRTKFSRIINGTAEARWEEKEAIARVLRVSVDEIFPSSRVGVA